MATLTLTLNIPDDKVQDLADALNWKWKTNLTPAQLQSKIEDVIRGQLVNAYRSHQRYLISQTPITNDIDIG